MSAKKPSRQEEVLNRAFGAMPKEVCFYMDLFEKRPPRPAFARYLRLKKFFYRLFDRRNDNE